MHKQSKRVSDRCIPASWLLHCVGEQCTDLVCFFLFPPLLQSLLCSVTSSDGAVVSGDWSCPFVKHQASFSHPGLENSFFRCSSKALQHHLSRPGLNLTCRLMVQREWSSVSMDGWVITWGRWEKIPLVEILYKEITVPSWKSPWAGGVRGQDESVRTAAG